MEAANVTHPAPATICNRLHECTASDATHSRIGANAALRPTDLSETITAPASHVASAHWPQGSIASISKGGRRRESVLRQPLRIVHSRQRLAEKTPDVVKSGRRIVVIVHQAMLIASSRRSFIDNRSNSFHRRATVIRGTRAVNCRLLHGAVDAPCRSGRWADTIVHSIPNRRRGQKRSRALYDPPVHHVGLDFV